MVGPWSPKPTMGVRFPPRLQMKIIAIAGGSGSGKSTVSYNLEDNYPEIFEVFNLDDYQKLSNEQNLPMIGEKINWEHPDVINWNKLIRDITNLLKGKPVTIQTWAHRSNPDYFKHRNMIKRTIKPKKILIIEGYLALYKDVLRKLCERSYFLDLDIKKSIKRREKFEDSSYDNNVLVPMHKKYVEPTKKFADLVLDASKLSQREIYAKIEKDIRIYFAEEFN